MSSSPILEIKRPLVLATASEARRRLVAETGIPFIPDAVAVEESVLPGESLGEYVVRLARAKAEAVVPPSLKALVVAVDTAIGLDGEIIGKPSGPADARRILERLSGKWHEVASAIALRDIEAGSVAVELVRTGVRFCRLAEPILAWYLASGEWEGRAGAYAIQGRGALLVAEIRGCFTNVIGISIPTLLGMLQRR